LEEGESATGVLITDKSHVPGGDWGSVRPENGERLNKCLIRTEP